MASPTVSGSFVSSEATGTSAISTVVSAAVKVAIGDSAELFVNSTSSDSPFVSGAGIVLVGTSADIWGAVGICVRVTELAAAASTAVDDSGVSAAVTDGCGVISAVGDGEVAEGAVKTAVAPAGAVAVKFGTNTDPPLVLSVTPTSTGSSSPSGEAVITRLNCSSIEPAFSASTSNSNRMPLPETGSAGIRRD